MPRLVVAASTDQRLSPHHSETCWLPLALPPSPFLSPFLLSHFVLSLWGAPYISSPFFFLGLCPHTPQSLQQSLPQFSPFWPPYHLLPSSPPPPSPHFLSSLSFSIRQGFICLTSQTTWKPRPRFPILFTGVSDKSNCRGNRKKSMNLSTTKNIPSITKFQTKLRAHLKIARYPYRLNMMYQKQMRQNRKNV